MAFNSRYISPDDFNANQAIGVALPFSGGNDGVFLSTYQTKDAIRYNLINYFLTNKGERVFRPTFGGDLRRTLFEQLSTDNLDLVEETINSDLETNFPSVDVQELNVFATPERNILTIQLTYKVLNTGIEDTIEISVNNNG